MDTKMKHKIYCFNNGESAFGAVALAVGDDGKCLASHICSHEGYMRHDLGITSTLKHENYNTHFGEGNWELEWVDDVENHPILWPLCKQSQSNV